MSRSKQVALIAVYLFLGAVYFSFMHFKDGRPIIHPVLMGLSFVFFGIAYFVATRKTGS